MVNIINSFFSYFVLVLFVVVIAAVAITAGIILRKQKNKKDAEMAAREAIKESERENE